MRKLEWVFFGVRNPNLSFAKGQYYHFVYSFHFSLVSSWDWAHGVQAVWVATISSRNIMYLDIPK